MSGDPQEPTLGEVMRGQARLELALTTFTAAAEQRDHSFRNAINANNVAIAVHTQRLADLAQLETKVESVTGAANKIAGAWALFCVAVTALIAVFKR